MTRWEASHYHERAMKIQTALLAEIEAFLAERGMAESTFGRLAVNDGKLVRRLRAGSNMTLTTVEKVRGFIASSSSSSREAA